jgi:hypothetical protein
LAVLGIINAVLRLIVGFVLVYAGFKIYGAIG